MKRIHLVVALALIVAACGGTTADVTTTTPEAPTTVVETTTTTAAPTTTTTAAAPTTTAAPDREALGGSELRRIQAAMSRTAETPSARMVGEIRIVGASEFDGEFAFSFSGAYDNETGDSSFSIDMSSLADLLSAETEGASTEEDEFGAMFAELFMGMFTKFEVRQIGDTVYMNNPFFVAMAGVETEWIAMPAGDDTQVTGGFVDASPGDPSELLGGFEDTDGVVEEIGTEVVNGVETTHYRITYDTEALWENASPEERAALEESQVLAGDELVLDVWVTDEHVHRFVMDVDGSELDLPPDEQFERMTFTYEITQWGEDVVIEPPPADQVTFVDDESFGMGLDFSG